MRFTLLFLLAFFGCIQLTSWSVKWARANEYMEEYDTFILVMGLSFLAYVGIVFCLGFYRLCRTMVRKWGHRKAEKRCCCTKK